MRSERNVPCRKGRGWVDVASVARLQCARLAEAESIGAAPSRHTKRGTKADSDKILDGERKRLEFGKDGAYPWFGDEQGKVSACRGC